MEFEKIMTFTMPAKPLEDHYGQLASKQSLSWKQLPCATRAIFTAVRSPFDLGKIGTCRGSTTMSRAWHAARIAAKFSGRAHCPTGRLPQTHRVQGSSIRCPDETGGASSSPALGRVQEAWLRAGSGNSGPCSSSVRSGRPFVNFAFCMPRPWPC